MLVSYRLPWLIDLFTTVVPQVDGTRVSREWYCRAVAAVQYEYTIRGIA